MINERAIVYDREFNNLFNYVYLAVHCYIRRYFSANYTMISQLQEDLPRKINLMNITLWLRIHKNAHGN